MPRSFPVDVTSSLSSLLTPRQWDEMVRDLSLTPRQTEIVRLVLQARRDKEIAAALGLKVSTVRMHLRYAYRHLGIRERQELVVLAFGRFWRKYSRTEG